MSTRKTLYFYLHTHWDREWYLPFDAYRVALLQTVRDVLDKLESRQLPNFLLDGQSCALEDLAEVDPSLVARIKALMKEGVLSAGPWYVLADQMLVSGESLVRNLKMGLAVTRHFGQPALVGYCPDTFGHTVDLPRILKGFDIDNAFVWRGVPELDQGPIFWWQSPDGSRVLCYHLARGYYQPGLHHKRNQEELLKFFLPWLGLENDESSKSYAYSHLLKGTLVPVGADHMAPPIAFSKTLTESRALLKSAWPNLSKEETGNGAGDAALSKTSSRTAAKTSARSTAAAKTATKSTASTAKKSGGLEPQLVPITLPDFVAALREELDERDDEIACLAEELRDNSAALAYERAYMLPGVLSTRLYLKRENRLAEHRLFRLCEPFFAWLAAAGIWEYPGRELSFALKQLLRNHPHDSICGCSVDPVHEEMMQRTRGFHNLLYGLDSRAAESLSRAAGDSTPRFAQGRQPVADPEMSADKLIVFNASSEAAVGPIPLTWAVEKGQADLMPIVVERDGTDVQVVSHSVRTLIFTGFQQEPSAREVEVFDGWIWLGSLPAVSSKECSWQLSSIPPRVTKVRDFSRKHELVSNDGGRIANEFLSVEIAPDGMLMVSKTDSRKRSRTYKLNHVIRDVADGGDTYNFDPIQNDRPIVARLKEVAPGQRGPLVASLRLTYEIAIPSHLDTLPAAKAEQAPDEHPQNLVRSSHLILHEVTTEISLRRGVPIVFFETSFDNQSSDHRMEVVFDTGLAVVDTFAENHFSIIRRETPSATAQLPVKKGTEAPLDRLACQRFFIANSQLFLNQGLPEYAVDGSAVSMTILRAVSYLSRDRLRTRGGGAGPPVPTPQANSFGVNRVSYGWAPLGTNLSKTRSRDSAEQELSDDLAIQAYRLAEQYEGTARAFLCKDSVGKADGKALLQLDNLACRLTALYASDDGDVIYARILNVTSSSQDCNITLGRGIETASLCNLNEKSLKKLQSAKGAPKDEAVYKLRFGANELVTVALAISKKR